MLNPHLSPWTSCSTPFHAPHLSRDVISAAASDNKSKVCVGLELPPKKMGIWPIVGGFDHPFYHWEFLVIFAPWKHPWTWSHGHVHNSKWFCFHWKWAFHMFFSLNMDEHAHFHMDLSTKKLHSMAQFFPGQDRFTSTGRSSVKNISGLGRSLHRWKTKKKH